MSSLAPMYALLAESSKMKPYEEFERDWLANRRQETINKTELIQLAELKRAQEAAAAQRAFYQQHPEIALGQGQPHGPQSILGGGGMPAAAPAPMMQTTMVPGQPPGQQQMIPGGQDLSQFATQGGLPMQSTLGQPGPQQAQAPPNPLLELMRSNPDAALAVQQRVQQFQEKRLDWQAKRMGYFGQVLQGVNSPESYEAARREIGRVDPQAAAQLPPTYSKEALQPYITQAVDVAKNAELRLKAMHEQTEQGKLQAQLAQAGYQGLGTDVTAILRGLTPEQVQQFGGRTSDKAIAYATEEEKKRKLTQVTAEQQLKHTQEQELQAKMPLQDARKEDAGLFVSKGTGQTIPGTTPYGQVKQLQDEKDPEKGVIKLANLDEKKQLTTLKQLEPVLQQYADLVQYAYGPNGPLENYTRSPSSVLGAAAGQATQNDPTFQAKRRALQGQLQSVVRGLGARGDLNEQELAAAKEMIANMDASMGLGLSLGPVFTTSGPGVTASVKPTISIPDTPETGINLANELIGTVNRRIGSILQHEGYSKTPFITLRTNQQGQPQPGVMPQARPGSQAPPLPSTVPPRTWGTMPPATPGQPPPPAAQPPAASVPAPGAPIFPPAPAIRLPGEGPAPSLPPTPTTQPTPPTATSTPAQDAAYRQSVAPRSAPTPAPSAPATRPTPGRQSQATPSAPCVRLAGGPKYMDLADVAEAMRQTGRSRREVEAAARSKGYTVYGSRLPLPEVTGVA